MPITKKQKAEILENVDDKFSKYKALLFTSFSKVSVEDLRDLRKKFKEKGVEYKVIKKNLANIAIKKAGFENVDLSQAEGSLGIAFSKEDQISLAKMAHAFAKAKKDVFKILSGVFDSQTVGADKIAALASAGSRDELYARLLRQFNAPASKLVYAIKEIVEKNH